MSAGIVVVEDTVSLREDLVEFLLDRGFDAFGAGDGRALDAVMANHAIDLVLLDLNLPLEGGFSIARRLRQTSDVGIVILSCRDADRDRVSGIEAGADAYLVKEASLELIEATCRGVLRRVRPGRPNIAPADHAVPWRLETTGWRLSGPTGGAVRLTGSEFELLAVIMQEPGATIAREEILSRMGRVPTRENERAIEVRISRLKRRVGAEIGQPLPLQSIYGRGYCFQAAALVTP
ncbi:response regulator transcription factor [Kaistia dalseonensis]|uniref:DNA-binding response OmpR family regulator n=1 Tax=Kaistia dalseonensis TaxID=410840 RepID=A0ABU0H0M2_9HYPH|nr:response regulator transcription factor [Kaistia dalseonensis]MCX5493303.1 response regulator transcription factor [Kaistia dalseonensis]MDQ0435860.1 DNA-binding response OmpR family regulator [Kaistia dalseonensis]